jgi:antitoxin component of RelBE/YafQ-DinJ toxin-antitoxin module
VPRKRAEGKEQINSWIDQDLANDIREIQQRLGLPYMSDAVKLLLETGLETYAHERRKSTRKIKSRTKTSKTKKF